MAKMNKQKLIVIVGPTASGKSELAVRLAKQFKGEIVSADSRQVYKNLDIGTGKVPGEWKRANSQRIVIDSRKHISAKPKSNAYFPAAAKRHTLFVYKDIPHYCIDFVNPKKQYSVAEYKKCANKAIENIASRGKLPILAGGTGLYVQAVVDGMELPAVAPNSKLRKILEKKTPAQLFAMLQKLDPARAKTIDAKNPRRLVRAIEIARALGKVPPSHLETKFPSTYDLLIIGLKPQLDKIKVQGTAMLKCGLLKEITSLITSGLSKKRIRELGFEYKYPLDYFEGKIPSLKDLKNILAKENWRYAKRQMTWFKRDKRIHWVSEVEAAQKHTQQFLSKRA